MRMLVLVAHTDRWTRLVVRDVVVEAGSTVVEASNGMSALRLAQQTQPDLVLLGPTLSEIEPGEVLGLLRADMPTRGIPVLMLRATGHRAAPARGRCAQMARRRRNRRSAARRSRRHAGAAPTLVRHA
jgi:CheY-like chemotaxis protein